jgi:hypothetical protein
MNIGLDFDLTFTADEPFWRQFIANAHVAGHSVWIVTCRRDCDENREEVFGAEITNFPSSIAPRTGLKTYRHKFTSGSPKRWFMDKQGIKIDIWIDDQPETIINGK